MVEALGTLGILLLVAGGLAIVIEMALAAVWGVRLGRVMRSLAVRLEGERAQIEADVERLRRAIEQTRALWRPYRRILRWLRHPLVVAMLGSYRRRMAAR